jgi:hypothetical protein
LTKTQKTNRQVGPKKEVHPVAEERQATTPASKKKGAPVTEKAVPSTPKKKTSQYVVTVDNETGLAVKIEKLEGDTGKRKELSKEEYAGLSAYAGLADPYGAMYSPMSASSVSQAYCQGIADYLKALSSAGQT